MARTKQQLEQVLTSIAGLPVEITIRGLRSFTMSFEAVDDAATARLTQYFAGQAQTSVMVDAETGTYIYLEAGR